MIEPVIFLSATVIALGLTIAISYAGKFIVNELKRMNDNLDRIAESLEEMNL